MSDQSNQGGGPPGSGPGSWISAFLGGPAGQGSVAPQQFLDALNGVRRALNAQTQFSIIGRASALNLTSAAVIKASPGRLRKLVIIAPGSGSGAFQFNDCLTTGTAAAANLVWSLPYNSSLNVAGAIIPVDLPFLVGIVLSAVPGAGSPICAVSFD